MRHERDLLEAESLPQRLEVRHVMVDRKKIRIGRQRRPAAAALVVVDDAVMLLQRGEVGLERQVIHARPAVDHDHRRALPDLGIPDADAIRSIHEVLRLQGNAGDGEEEYEQQFPHSGDYPREGGSRSRCSTILEWPHCQSARGRLCWRSVLR
jgi:hypothetical protein